MKILNRKDFLKMPEGTFFSSGSEWVIDGFMIKKSTIFDNFGNGIDFFYQSLNCIHASNSEELFESLELSLKEGKSFFINNCDMREGLFDDDIRYLIYEKKDLEYIKNLLP